MCPLCSLLVCPADSGSFPQFVRDHPACTDRPDRHRTLYRPNVAVGLPAPFPASPEWSASGDLCKRTYRTRSPKSCRLRLSSGTRNCSAPPQTMLNRCICVLSSSSFPDSNGRCARLLAAPTTLLSRYPQRKSNFPEIYCDESGKLIVCHQWQRPIGVYLAFSVRGVTCRLPKLPSKPTKKSSNVLAKLGCNVDTYSFNARENASCSSNALANMAAARVGFFLRKSFIFTTRRFDRSLIMFFTKAMYVPWSSCNCQTEGIYEPLPLRDSWSILCHLPRRPKNPNIHVGCRAIFALHRPYCRLLFYF